MRWLLVLLGMLAAVPASALSPAAQEFMAITKELEPVQCEKRRLRRQIADAGLRIVREELHVTSTVKRLPAAAARWLRGSPLD